MTCQCCWRVGWVILCVDFSMFCCSFFKDNLKDLFLFQDVIQQHCVKLFNKWVRILTSVFSKRKRLCGKACGKCGSSENIHYVTQRGTEIQEAREKLAEWAVKSAVCKSKLLHLQRLYVSSLSSLTKPSLPQIQSQKGSLKILKPPLKNSYWPNTRSTKLPWISCINLSKYCSMLSADLIVAGYAFTVIPGSPKNLETVSIQVLVL